MPVRVVEVVAGLLRDASGRVLVTERPVGGEDGGLWEFPGGKIEAGESPQQALARELAEELGIGIGASEALHRVTQSTPTRRLRLHGLTVAAFAGTPHGREGQRLRWVDPIELDHLPMPRADRPLVTALRIPRVYAVSAYEPSIEGTLAWLQQTLTAGARLLQLRVPQQDDAFERLARTAIAQCRAADARLILNADVASALALDADGVHLSSARLRPLTARPLPPDRLVLASCHHAEEMAHALAVDCDAIVLGPVAPTPSHPNGRALGWHGVEALLADYPLPAFLIGGLGPRDLSRARIHGAFGVAGIRAFRGDAGREDSGP
jgi:8-oxo-dGTP diphosphatase